MPFFTLSLFFPALAAALAAIRAQGEFAQLEIRYRGVHAALAEIGVGIEGLLKEPAQPLLSARLARLTREATAAMVEEVSLWRTLLITNEIER